MMHCPRDFGKDTNLENPLLPAAESSEADLQDEAEVNLKAEAVVADQNNGSRHCERREAI